MKRVLCLFLLLTTVCRADDYSAQWRYSQEFSVPNKGVYQFDLAPDLMDKSQADFRDLRLVDQDGQEMPFVITTASGPVRQPPANVKSFTTAWSDGNTVVHLKIHSAEPVTEISLSIPSNDFHRSAQLEAFDGRDWVTLLDHYPIYRQNFPFAENTSFQFAAIRAQEFRITIPDEKEKHVIIHGASIRAEETYDANSAPTITYPVTIRDRVESAGQSYYLIELPAGNFPIYSLRFNIGNPVFQRQMRLAVPNMEEGTIRENIIGAGTLLRTADTNNNDPKIQVRLYGCQSATRQCRLYIENQDNPPLSIQSLEATTIPRTVTFYALKSGHVHIWTGNPKSPKPSYDIAGLKIPEAEKLDIHLALTSNAQYKGESFALGQEILGGVLEPHDWKYSFDLQQKDLGVQELELPLQTLALTGEFLGDVRLVRGNTQIPYLVERLPIHRAIELKITPDSNNAKNQVSQWKIQLPVSQPPIRDITLGSTSPLFDRNITLYEKDAEGKKMNLGFSSWSHQPHNPQSPCVITLNQIPSTDTLWIETDNGDNAPIEISKAECHYPIVRLIYYVSTSAPMQLLTGNPHVSTPRYDIASIANDFKSRTRSPATLTDKSIPAPATETFWTVGENGADYIYWIILAGVVAGLFLVMAKLLPKPKE